MDVLVVIVFLLVVSMAWSAFIQVPENGTYSEGSDIILKCVTREEKTNILWRDLEENNIIFIGKELFTKKDKYRNFQISPSPRNYSLTIKDASPNDEGLYSCQDGDEHRNAWITIEGLPTLVLLINGSVANEAKIITFTNGDTIIVTCTAENIGPKTFLELKYGGGNWTKLTPLKQDSTGSYTSSTVTDVHILSLKDSTISCRSIGKAQFLQREVTIDLLHKPRCRVEIRGNKVQCICVANPSVKQYRMVVNGEAKSNSTSINTRNYIPANFSCLAVNDIGLGHSETLLVSILLTVPTALVVTGSAIFCISLMCIVLWKKNRLVKLFNSLNSLFTSCDNDGSVINTPVNQAAWEIPMNISTEGTLDTYEKLYARIPMDKIIVFSNITIASHLKKSIESERWLGTLKSIGRVVISSPTVDRSEKSQTDWALYVKKLLDLQSNTNIVNIRGVCIETGRFYVIQEYVPNGTLTSHLISLQQYAETTSTSLTFLELASSLLHGIDFLRCNEFYHPGLSSDKILIAADMKCKLYDFCTADMVKDKIRYTMEKQKESLCQFLPPEAVFQNVYDETSEIWPIAVNLWRIFSCGKTLTLSFQQSRSGNKILVSNIPERPAFSPVSFFKLILKCWDICSSNRPTVKELIAEVDKEVSVCQESMEKNEDCSYPLEVALYQDNIYCGNECGYEVTAAWSNDKS